MRNTTIYILLLTLSAFIFTDCGSKTFDEDDVVEAADSFLLYYVTWHFPDAMPFADADGQRWLRFMSTNVHSADLDEISKAKRQPSYSIDHVDVSSDTATVKLTLNDVILMDTLGRRAHLQSEAQRTLTLVKYTSETQAASGSEEYQSSALKGNKWKIHSIK